MPMRQPPCESLPSPGRDHAGAIRPDEPRLGVALHGAFHANHVARRNAFGDAHHHFQTGIHAFQNGVRGKGRRHKNGGGGRAGLFHRLGDGVKNGHFFAAVFENLAAFAGRDAGDDLRAVINGKLRVFGAEAAGDALDQDFGVGFDENGHWNFRFWICDLRFVPLVNADQLPSVS